MAELSLSRRSETLPTAPAILGVAPEFITLRYTLAVACCLVLFLRFIVTEDWKDELIEDPYLRGADWPPHAGFFF